MTGVKVRGGVGRFSCFPSLADLPILDSPVCAAQPQRGHGRSG